MVGTVISIFSHGYPAAELLQNAKNHIIVIPVLYYVARLIKTDRQKTIVLLAMGLLLFLISAHTIWDTRDQIAHGLLLERHRAVGLVAGQANLYGGWLAMMVLGTICFAFSPLARGKPRLLLALTGLMGTVALIYTLSRGAWLALAVSVSMVALLRNRRILLLGTLVLFLLPALVSPAVRERAASITAVLDSMDDEPEEFSTDEAEEADPSAMVRVHQWKELPHILADAPLLGHGYGYFPDLWREIGYTRKAAHSSIIEIGAELGLLGLISYAALVFPMILLGWRHSKRGQPPLERAVGTTAFGMGLCLLLLDTSGTRFRNSEVMGNFWVIAGMVAGSWGTPGGLKPEESATDAQQIRPIARRRGALGRQ
jgi:O-antigen ligase